MTDSGPITPGNVGFMKQPTHAKALREMFDAGWKAAARFCDRDDAVADGIVGFDACSQFESAFAEALRDQRAGVATPAAPAQPGQERGDLPPLPDADLRDVGTTSQEIRDFLRGYATEYARTALAARAAPQPAVTAGWVMVPIEPTEEMLANVDQEVGGHCHSCSKWRASYADCKAIWADMLSALPCSIY